MFCIWIYNEWDKNANDKNEQAGLVGGSVNPAKEATSEMGRGGMLASFQPSGLQSELKTSLGKLVRLWLKVKNREINLKRTNAAHY